MKNDVNFINYLYRKYERRMNCFDLIYRGGALVKNLSLSESGRIETAKIWKERERHSVWALVVDRWD